MKKRIPKLVRSQKIKEVLKEQVKEEVIQRIEFVPTIQYLNDLKSKLINSLNLILIYNSTPPSPTIFK